MIPFKIRTTGSKAGVSITLRVLVPGPSLYDVPHLIASAPNGMTWAQSYLSLVLDWFAQQDIQPEIEWPDDEGGTEHMVFDQTSGCFTVLMPVLITFADVGEAMRFKLTFGDDLTIALAEGLSPNGRGYQHL